MDTRLRDPDGRTRTTGPGPTDAAGCAISIFDWVPPPDCAAVVALQMEISPGEQNGKALPRWVFTIPGGPLRGARECYTLRIISPVPPPSRWVRFWSRLLVGWTWKAEKESEATSEA